MMKIKPGFQQRITHMQTLVEAALSAANPAKRMELHIEEIQALMRSAQKCWVVGVGKASLEMASALYERLGLNINGGAIAVVPERLESLHDAQRKRLPFELYPASHPLPTEQNIRAARAIADIARVAGEGDLLLCLISGGGSAHLTLPVVGLGLSEYREVTNQLMRAGAAIQELNAVRKHAEQLKGGGLLRLADPARVHALILSDVMGDSLDVIASGPVSADPTRFEDALRILRQYEIQIPQVLKDHLEAGVRGEHPETLKANDPLLKRASHTIIGSNTQAVEAVKQAAIQMGFSILAVETGVEGEAREIGQRLGNIAHQLKERGDLPGLVIFGGETTVTVQGNGLGGRNQEMVLSAALALEGLNQVVFMSFATDGIDGPTDAAGAYADGNTVSRARTLGLDPYSYLVDNDSHTFFNRLGTLIETGPTGTNVNDVSVVIVYS